MLFFATFAETEQKTSFIMRKKIRFRFSRKYYGFLRKHTKMWWRKVKKEFIKNGIHPKVLYYGNSGIVDWTIRECPLIRFGAWMTDRTDTFTLFADWEDLIDKFKPGRCPYNFNSVDEMIKESVKIVSLYKEGGKSFNDYLLNHNGLYNTYENVDMLELLKDEREIYRRNGMTQEAWDKAFYCRDIKIEEAVADKNVWGVVVAPHMDMFNIIPEALYVAIEDDEDKITDEEFNAALDKWTEYAYSASFEGNFDMEVVTKDQLLKYANRDKATRRRFTKAYWKKGEFVRLRKIKKKIKMIKI